MIRTGRAVLKVRPTLLAGVLPPAVWLRAQADADEPLARPARLPPVVPAKGGQA